MVVRFFFCVDLVPVATAAASQTRNQEETCPKVGKGEIGRSTSIGAMDSCKSLFWKCLYLELSITGKSPVFLICCILYLGLNKLLESFLTAR
ncbi:hypothetical protein B296_00053681 [Ensete ventricosum]|uniref:Secreted protein n=1 Tax=Ensete ventricosum TaxID=4639 RepID=A0A426X9V5_ENSVE|nr:hypothetical protein B296_00053681 [Ensete ventricosum]